MATRDEDNLIRRLGRNERIITDAAAGMLSLVLELGPTTDQARESITNAVMSPANARPSVSNCLTAFIGNYLVEFSTRVRSARMAYEDVVGILRGLNLGWYDLNENERQLVHSSFGNILSKQPLFQEYASVFAALSDTTKAQNRNMNSGTAAIQGGLPMMEADVARLRTLAAKLHREYRHGLPSRRAATGVDHSGLSPSREAQ